MRFQKYRYSKELGLNNDAVIVTRSRISPSGPTEWNICYDKIFTQMFFDASTGFVQSLEFLKNVLKFT